MERHQPLIDEATYSSLDDDFETSKRRRTHQKKKPVSWSRPRLLRKLLRIRPRGADKEGHNDHATVNLSADSTSYPPAASTADDLFTRSFPARLRNKANASLPNKQIYYIPKFTDPVAAFGSDEVESFFAQLDVKDDNAKVYLAQEGTEVVLCREEEDINQKFGKNASNIDEDIFTFTTANAAPWNSLDGDNRPVSEISFVSQDDDIINASAESTFSSSFDQTQFREEIFASFVDDDDMGGSAQAPSSPTKQRRIKDAEGSPRNRGRSTMESSPMTPKSVTNHSSSKQTSAMLKRKSAFTGEDLLTQEAEVFSSFLEENSPSVPPSPIVAVHRSKDLSESRLIMALNAVDFSDDDDSAAGGSSAFQLDKYYSAAAVARSAASEAASSLPAYSQAGSSTTSDVFSRINTQADSSTGDIVSRLSYDTGDLTNSYAPSVRSNWHPTESEDFCMGFFFPTDPIEDDLTIPSADLSDLSHYQHNGTSTEEAFAKLQRMARKSTSEFLGFLK